MKMASFTAVAGDVVVFAWIDGVLRGHDVRSGRPLWEVKSDLQLYGGLAVMGGAVYAVSDAGVVLGLEAKTGREVWRKNLGIPVYSYPAASGNTLTLADWDGNVYAFVGR